MLSSAVISSIIDSVSERVNNSENFFILWYSLSFGSISQTLQNMCDPIFSLICLVPTERWAENDDAVKMLVVFFFY